MGHRGHFLSRGAAAAIALAVALPFNALAAEPTPDPPEPHLIGIGGVGGATLGVGGATLGVGGATPVWVQPSASQAQLLFSPH